MAIVRTTRNAPRSPAAIAAAATAASTASAPPSAPERRAGDALKAISVTAAGMLAGRMNAMPPHVPNR